MTHLDLLSLSYHAFDDERTIIQHYCGLLAHLKPHETEIITRATRWVEAIRAQGIGHGMEAFLQTYGLDTKEGVALMCLAEALLRIPDSHTANQLIQLTFDDKNWRQYITGNESWTIAASSWGLLLTGKVIDLEQEERGFGGIIKRMVTRVGEPVIREALKKAMRVIGNQFVLGEHIDDGLNNARPWHKKGYRFSFDILGEGARSDAQAQAYLAAYRDAIVRIGNHNTHDSLFEAPSISIKLSALHPRYQMIKRQQMHEELVPRIKEIITIAQQQRICVSIDAEEANRLEIEMEIFEALLADPTFAGWNGIGFVLQAYQKRAVHVIDMLAHLAQTYQRIIPLRLVKGAYWDSEIKSAQIQGLDGYPVFTRKEHTDVSYLACADKILQKTQYFYPQFATHNARTIATIQTLAEQYRIAPEAYEFQRLHGMGEALHDHIRPTYASRIYAPIGEHKDLLAYLIRRLLENGANSSFVHLLMDANVSMEELLADPIRISESGLDRPLALALPCDLYPDRRNSKGVDLGYHVALNAMQRALEQHHTLPPAPKDHARDDVAHMIATAYEAYPAWGATDCEQRALILEKIADLYEQERDQLLALLVHEAGKTLIDAVAELREAIDFCIYYAHEARRTLAHVTLHGPTGESNELHYHPRGVVGCISPWNFPLAIFTGQIVAALVSGNAVIAKPAEQTPRIAMLAAQLMHHAGIPQAILQLAFGEGEIVGAAITEDERIAAMVFTGSVDVAKIIQRTLAHRKGAIIPLIAETGGMNCMVIDSSALLETAVDDVMLSAFGSAGQRCSALRVLYIQEDIADAFLTLLEGAMHSLIIGNPALCETDIGPVIDASAYKMLHDHINMMRSQGILRAAAPLTSSHPLCIAPHVFEITSIDVLKQEIFGPILHVIRFKAGALAEVAQAINRAGYGLTFGVHSRIENNIQFLLQHVHVGNYYVNRSMIGAVVGVQPFGGEGLSGTGPKAGGPNYLMRFVHERVVTINSAAIGGNLHLLQHGGAT
ncbi:MAG: bifunctional proline dehydrogenase/L-glutamate gamma-semialdehyde dehydrogenase PutA [Alphaproteobacteria bacterium]|nr:MAG: bifunctional proline dehydrogenase/L-glutamate gamma-semialdehyde dehydrogenase PutA [Alphaproteobacteria bacterium]TAF76502.1 MAG: bifunctional proline dehydrogenase/L-glutamate gamma-semialdehyde dehydrogenase PutA [Alphaproteobacteria bacterium]